MIFYFFFPYCTSNLRTTPVYYGIKITHMNYKKTLLLSAIMRVTVVIFKKRGENVSNIGKKKKACQAIVFTPCI